MNVTCEFTTDSKALKAAIDQIRPILKNNSKNSPSASVEIWFSRNRFGFVAADPQYKDTIWTCGFKAEGGMNFRVQTASDCLFSLPIPKGKAVPVAIEIMTDLTGKWEKIKVVINGSTRYLRCSEKQDSSFKDFVDEREGEKSKTTFKASDLLNGLSATKSSMAVKDVRYYLNGTLIEQTSSKTARLVSTDGHRMTIFDMGAFHEKGSDTPLLENSIINRDTCLHLITLLKNQHEDCDVEVTRNGPYIRFRIIGIGRGIDFVSTIIDGRYPDYERVVYKGDCSIEINRARLVDALNIIKMPRDPAIKMDIGIEDMTLTVNPLHDDEEDRSFITIPISNPEKVEPIPILFSQKYITDVMKSVFTEEVVNLQLRSEVEGSNTEGIYCYDASVNFVNGPKMHVLMPRRA